MTEKSLQRMQVACMQRVINWCTAEVVELLKADPTNATALKEKEQLRQEWWYARRLFDLANGKQLSAEEIDAAATICIPAQDRLLCRRAEFESKRSMSEDPNSPEMVRIARIYDNAFRGHESGFNLFYPDWDGGHHSSY